MYLKYSHTYHGKEKRFFFRVTKQLTRVIQATYLYTRAGIGDWTADQSMPMSVNYQEQVNTNRASLYLSFPHSLSFRCTKGTAVR